MEEQKGKSGISLRNTVIIVLITNFITAIILLYAPLPKTSGAKFNSEQEKKFVEQFGKMIEVKEKVEENYIEKIDQDKMVEGAIKGMVDSIGDPYTVFMNEKEFSDMTTHTTGSYAGIGTYVGDKDGKIVIIAPIEDSPAEKAGIKAGDIILKVDDQDVQAKDMDKAVSLMKGKVNTKVKLTIFREGSGIKDYTITRAKITIKTVKGEMLQNNIAYIKITQFDEHTADDFNAALNQLLAKSAKGLVLDLRNNPGGLLLTSSEVADRLLGEGTIVYTIDKDGKKEVLKSKADKLNIPLAVLVNGGSASASEIVSGAIRDFKAGTLIGTRTFGKGLVQSVIPLGDGTGVKVTIAKYYTPSGECIQGIGITPDIVIDLPDKDKARFDELKHEEDIQLQKAIEVIMSKQ